MSPVDVQPYGPARIPLVVSCPDFEMTRDVAERIRDAAKRALPACDVLVVGRGVNAEVQATTRIEISGQLDESKVTAFIEDYLRKHKGMGGVV